VILACRRHACVLSLRQRVIFPHQPLQLGEFAHHLGEQIRFGEARGSPDPPTVRILLALQIVGRKGLPWEKFGPTRQRQRDFVGKSLDARDALGLGAELLVKDDVLELRQPVLELRLQVGVVEEFSIGEPRADDPLVAGDDCPAAILGLDIGDEDELVGEPALILRDGASRLLRMRASLRG